MKSFPLPSRMVVLAEDRAANLIDRTSRAYRIKPDCAQHIPGRCSTAIVVAWNAERTIPVPDIHQLPDPLLRLPRLPGEVVEIRDVEARLVALRVKADQAGRVGKLAQELIFRRAVLLDKQADPAWR